MAGVLSYRRLVLRRAWANAASFARQHLAGTVVATLAALVALPAVILLPGSPLLQEGALQVIYGVLGPVLIFGVAFLIYWTQASGQIFAENQARIQELEARLTPRVSFLLPPAPGLTNIDQGHTSETLGGRRYTVETARSEVVSVHVRNDSATSIESGMAKLIQAWNMGADGSFKELGMVEPVTLNWSPEINGETRVHFVLWRHDVFI